MLLAHETWFVDDPDGRLDWGFTGDWVTLIVIAAAVVAALVVRLLSRLGNGVDVAPLARMAPFMPFALRMLLAVSLVGLLSLGRFISPAMELEGDVVGFALGTAMALVAIAMVAGWLTREAAWLLIAAAALGVIEYGLGPMLSRLDVLGLAAFVLVAGPGRWSADHELGQAAERSPRRVSQAVWALALAVGAALVVGAFTEKLANPDLAQALLGGRPYLNVAAEIGILLNDVEFLRVAGGIQLLFGLLLISGALPQLVVLAIGIPFNALLFFFGTNELIGHLPIYGAMVALLVYGSDPDLRGHLRAPWPFGRERTPEVQAPATQPMPHPG